MNNYVKKEASKSKPFRPRRHEPKGHTESKQNIYKFLWHPDAKEADSVSNGRRITFQVINQCAEYLQGNIQMLVDFLNEEWELNGRENEIIGNSVYNDSGSFNFSLWTRKWKLTFDLMRGRIEKDFFLENVKEITGKGNQLNSKTEETFPTDKSSQNLTSFPQASKIENKEERIEKTENTQLNFLDLAIEPVCS